MLSSELVQGYMQFQAEAKLFDVVHHKYLIGLIGYCDDDTNMALIYEYMANGDLAKHLLDKSEHILILNQRLQIADDAAEGHWWNHDKTKNGRNYFQAGNHVYERLEVSEALRKALKIDSVVCGHALRSIILHNFSWECVLQVGNFCNDEDDASFWSCWIKPDATFQAKVAIVVVQVVRMACFPLVVLYGAIRVGLLVSLFALVSCRTVLLVQHL
ncbi:putative LRR receptor serine/threonine-protein kinase [Trifolium repens]|nr:putative LRR receptor serine/threonine-protein kinase [Trifolium repens]